MGRYKEILGASRASGRALMRPETQQGRCWEPVESTLKLPKYAIWPGYEANLQFSLRRYCALWGRGT